MVQLRLGTRASALARWQAEWVADQLTRRGHSVELVPITTRGDVVQQGPIGAIGTSGVFTKELQRALLDNRIDLAVHSLKDLPTEPVEGLHLAAVPERESPRDVLISRSGQRLAELAPGALLGTGSLRRQAQLKHFRPDLRTQDIRGNVDTRLGKLADGSYDGIILAEAGLKRLGLADRITEILPAETMLSAVGQGALGIETRQDDETTQSALATLDHYLSHQAVLAERSLLASLRGGCLAPVAAWARTIDDDRMQLDAAVLSPDGKERLIAFATFDPADAEQTGSEVAENLLLQGAARLIDASRQTR